VLVFLNAERFLREAVESVLGQSFSAWELLLVDDGSTDGSGRIAQAYAAWDPERIRYMTHEGGVNHGLSTSRNLGIRHSRGEYVAFLDADDVWLPCKLERQLALLRRAPDAAMVYGLSRYWYSWTGDPADAELDYVPPLGLEVEHLYPPPELLLLCYPIGRAMSPPPSGILVRRALLETVGGFEDGFPILYEDQVILAKLFLEAPAYVSSEEWDWYRIHPDSYSNRSVRAGEERAARRFFLEWLTAYLHARRISDERVWAALRKMMAAESRPHLWRMLRSTVSLSRFRRFLALLLSGTLRAHLRRRRWLRAKDRGTSRIGDEQAH
jgi:glycosyltransferase involved in cell wall biosynthesis